MTDSVQAAQAVVSTATATKFDGVLLDYFTASAIVAVANALSDTSRDTSRDKLAAMSLPRAAHICLTLANHRKGTS